MSFVNKLFQIFTNTNNWNLEVIISFVSILLVGVGGFFALFQWISANRIKRAELINQIVERLRFDQEIVHDRVRSFMV